MSGERTFHAMDERGEEGLFTVQDGRVGALGVIVSNLLAFFPKSICSVPTPPNSF
jgi:hypothetical protein